MCTPSRAGLLTGRHGLRTGIAGNFGPDSLYGLAETELTIADILKPAGYQSHMIGKVRTVLGLCGVGFCLVLLAVSHSFIPTLYCEPLPLSG